MRMRQACSLVLALGWLVMAGCEGDGAGAADAGGGAGNDAVATPDGGVDVVGADQTAPADLGTGPDATDPVDVPVGPDAADPVDGAGGPDAGDPGDASPDTSEPARVETRLDPVCVGERCAAGPEHAPDPGEWGPFPVGVKTFEFTDPEPPFSNEPRFLRTEIWYPTTDEYGDGPYEVYDLATDAPPELAEVFATVHIDGLQTRIVRDAPLRTADGPYPLVFFSHGAYGVRFQSTYLTEKLASHGYIVVAPDHLENTTWDYLLEGYDPVNVLASGGQRLGDAAYLMDKLFEIAADPESMFQGMIATKRVGYTGHSFGGFVSVSMAMRDDRLSVVVPMAPAANMAAASGNLGTFPVPFLMMGGEVDETLDFQQYMWQPYTNMPRPKAFLSFARGGHYTFTDMCSVDVVALAEELGWSDAEDALTDGCGENNFDPATARGIITHYAVAMFNAHLRLSPASLDYIDASYLEGYEGEVALDRQFDE